MSITIGFQEPRNHIGRVNSLVQRAERLTRATYSSIGVSQNTTANLIPSDSFRLPTQAPMRFVALSTACLTPGIGDNFVAPNTVGFPPGMQ